MAKWQAGQKKNTREVLYMGSNRIDGIRVKDYGLDTLETVTALQVQRYLGRLDVTSARKLLRAIIGGRMNKNTTIVNGQQLVELINIAAKNFRDEMEERILIVEFEEDDARIGRLWRGWNALAEGWLFRILQWDFSPSWQTAIRYWSENYRRGVPCKGIGYIYTQRRL